MLLPAGPYAVPPGERRLRSRARSSSDLLPRPQKLQQDIAAGHAVNNSGVSITFPTDSSENSQLARINAATVALQNMFGAGVGCPNAATTFGAQAAAIRAGTFTLGSSGAPTAAPAAAAPAATTKAAPAATTAAPASSGGALSNAQIDALAPQFGVTAGQSPDGAGNCIGINNVKIPCTCPPSRDQFISLLAADIEAGHATNNPGVAIKFPTDSSPQSEVTRIQASIVALQNLFGSGKGCPAASTTFSAQLAAAIAAA